MVSEHLFLYMVKSALQLKLQSYNKNKYLAKLLTIVVK